MRHASLIAILLAALAPACPTPPAAEGEGAPAEGEGEGEGAPAEGEGEGEGAGAEGEGEGEGEGSTAADPPLDEVRFKTAHNAFQRFEAFADMFAWHDVRSIELDLHIDRSGFTTTAGDWFVYHADNDTTTSCTRLSDCLKDIRAFERAAPNHEVITVFLDYKFSFDTASGHGKDDLDDAFRRGLGDTLYEAADFLADCPAATSLRDAVAGACGWPTLDRLQGKVLLVATGGRACGLGGTLDAYLGNDDGASRAALVAPQLDSTCPLASYDAHPGAIIFNVDVADHATFGPAVRAAGLMSRVFSANDENTWTQVLASQVHIIATDKVNILEDPFASTHQPNGFPFTCFQAADCAGRGRDERALGIAVDSGDIEGTGDDFAFVHADHGDAPAATLTAFVSTENSHVQEFAKGCLMARATTARGSPYVAVCRPADNHPLRLQARTTAGGSTTVTEADIAPADTLSEPNVAWAQLQIEAGGKCATARGSLDGVTFTDIGRACADVTLGLQGLAASSHDGGAVRFDFVAATRDGEPLDTSSLPVRTNVGTVRSRLVFTGPIP